MSTFTLPVDAPAVPAGTAAARLEAGMRVRVADRSVSGLPRVPISQTEFAIRARQLFERLAEAEAGEHVRG
jgi:hypothetical protein